MVTFDKGTLPDPLCGDGRLITSAITRGRWAAQLLFTISGVTESAGFSGIIFTPRICPGPSAKGIYFGLENTPEILNTSLPAVEQKLRKYQRSAIVVWRQQFKSDFGFTSLPSSICPELDK
jgi:hypothetical protein